MRRLLSLVPLAVVACLAGCGDPSTRAAIRAPPPASAPVVITAQTGVFDGKVTLDTQIASAIKLREFLEPRARAQLTEMQVEVTRAAAGQTLPKPWPGSIEWQATPAGDRYLNLLGRTAIYTGGAHSLVGVQAFVWDRLAERALYLPDLLVDSTAGSEPMQRLAALVREAVIAEKRRRSATDPAIPDYDPANDSFIGTGLAPQVESFANVNFAVPASADDAGGLVFHFAPYDVGPYSDGPYAVTVPADGARPLLRPALLVGLR